MLIVPAELAKKIDDNRGDISRSDFIEFLIDSQLKENTASKDAKPAVQYATKEEVLTLEQDLKNLLKKFFDFYVTYGLEMGVQPKEGEFEEISAKLQEIQNKEKAPEGEKGRATIKWK
jgi:hypothetical protein